MDWVWRRWRRPGWRGCRDAQGLTFVGSALVGSSASSCSSSRASQWRLQLPAPASPPRGAPRGACLCPAEHLDALPADGLVVLILESLMLAAQAGFGKVGEGLWDQHLGLHAMVEAYLDGPGRRKNHGCFVVRVSRGEVIDGNPHADRRSYHADGFTNPRLRAKGLWMSAVFPRSTSIITRSTVTVTWRTRVERAQ